MEDITKESPSKVEDPSPSSNNSRQIAMGLTFDLDSVEKLSKKRKNTNSTELPQAKKTKTSESGSTVNPILLEMQLKKNKARERAKKATEEEEDRMAAGPHGQHLKAAREAKIKKEEEEKALIEEGIDPQRMTRLNETAENVETEENKKHRQRSGDTTTLGPSTEAFAASFHRRQKDAAFNMSTYEAQKAELGEQFYSGSFSQATISNKPSEEKLVAMAAELAKQQKKRGEFHRRRTFKEEKDITFINEANRQYNKQLERAYGTQTAELKEAIERGTAL